jgi:hypothetical protein
LQGQQIDPLLLIALVDAMDKDVETMLLLDLHTVLDHGNRCTTRLEGLIEEGRVKGRHYNVAMVLENNHQDVGIVLVWGL